MCPYWDYCLLQEFQRFGSENMDFLWLVTNIEIITVTLKD